jgi:hypothetical protein
VSFRPASCFTAEAVGIISSPTSPLFLLLVHCFSSAAYNSLVRIGLDTYPSDARCKAARLIAFQRMRVIAMIGICLAVCLAKFSDFCCRLETVHLRLLLN